MHYYSFHPAKFAFETKHLSRLEKAIYRELIDEYMSDEKPFPVDIDDLAWRLSCKSEEERNALGTVLNAFFVVKKDKKGVEHYHHTRLDAEIRAYRWKHRGTDGTEQGTLEERNGTLNGTDKERKERYKKERSNMLNALLDIGVTLDKSIGMAELRKIYSDNFTGEKVEQGTEQEQNGTKRNGTEHLISDVKPKPVTSNQNQLLNISFGEFWDLYDKKCGDKSKIEAKWNKLKDQERIAIMNHIPQYKNSQPDKQYRKNPEAYLNNKSWNDEIITGQNHANNQPNHSQTTTAQPIKSSAELMHERNMADYNAWIERLARANSEPTANTVDFGNVYDVEAAIPVENEKPCKLESEHSSSMVSGFN